MTTVLSAAARFWSKVDMPARPDGCWLWTACIRSHGYGWFNAGGGRGPVCAHRWVYEQTIGPIPPGMQLDHLCRVRHCVNPRHLEPVTNRENGLRGMSPAALAARRTHCVNGHCFDAANTHRRPDGSRYCRACGRERERRRKARLKGTAA